MNSFFHMLENTVSKSMGDDMRQVGFFGEGRRTPKISCLFISEIKSFTAYITYRIICPGCDAVFMCIDGPGIRRATFRYHGPERRIGDHINPWSRRGFVSGRDDLV